MTQSFSGWCAIARRAKPLLPLVLAASLALGLLPGRAHACACGCSAFDVGAFGQLPQEDDHGGRVFFDWYHADQNRSWIGTSKASPALNTDKRITTDWYAAGVQYMFNRDWGVMAKLPYANRSFSTLDGDGNPARFKDADWGDLELTAMYTGFSKDMSTGLMLGLKLPTGGYTRPNFDRDTQIGTGSTDLILGAFHRGMITGDNAWQYFGQVRWLKPFNYRSSYNADAGMDEVYKPGAQVDGAFGIVYNNGYQLAGFDKVAPVLQLIGSHRDRDGGLAADPANTGFDRIYLSPGIELTKVLDEESKRVLKVYADVEVPIYQRTNAALDGADTRGQLVAPWVFKMSTSYNF